MITSLIDMLELPNFGPITTPTIYIMSRGKILLETSSAEIMTS